MSDEPSERLLSTQETLDKLGISRKTLYKMMERGQIAPVGEKPVYLTRRIKLQFRENDVEALISGTPESNTTK